ncbi:MAG: ABC transporter permease [Ruminiclostridium sp.]
MSDKFSIDDILAEFSEQNKQSKSNAAEKESKNNVAPKNNEPSATMILNSIDEKKKTDKKPEDTREVTAQSIREAMQKQKEAKAKAKAAQNSQANVKSVQKPEEKAKPSQKPEEKATPVQKPAEKAHTVQSKADSDSGYKRLSEFEEEKPKPVKKPADNKHTEKKLREKPVTAEKTAEKSSEKKTQDKKPVFDVNKKAESGSSVKSGAEKKPASSEKHELLFKKHTKPAKEKASVSINTSANLTFADKVKQNRFLFEELTKRDFKKKYKRAALGILWSVISPFLTFLIQFFVFGYIFKRLDSGFVVYVLSGTLMFTFFNNATTAGMFSMYSNGAILSKVKVPKSLFVLSSNSAAIFNFMLTLVVYFGFMIACGVSFGPHLLLMIFPIFCMIIFNIGVSYILSALFVFFKDIQYLYQIFTTLLSYISAIFYEIKAFPENLHILFYMNPIYQYISYMRELVMQSSVPSFAHHIVCLAFSFGMLGIGLLVHKKTEQKFVYYY